MQTVKILFCFSFALPIQAARVVSSWWYGLCGRTNTNFMHVCKCVYGAPVCDQFKMRTTHWCRLYLVHAHKMANEAHDSNNNNNLKISWLFTSLALELTLWCWIPFVTEFLPTFTLLYKWLPVLVLLLKRMQKCLNWKLLSIPHHSIGQCSNVTAWHKTVIFVNVFSFFLFLMADSRFRLI